MSTEKVFGAAKIGTSVNNLSQVGNPLFFYIQIFQFFNIPKFAMLRNEVVFFGVMFCQCSSANVLGCY